MGLTPDYLWVRDDKDNKLGMIKPEKFTCEMSHGKKNAISFTLPSSEKLLPVGSFVNLGDTIYGGRVTERYINATKKTVEYYGKSYYGLFAEQIFEVGTNPSTLKVSNTDDYPVAAGVQCLGITSCQSALSGTYNGVSYPKNGPVPLMHRNFGVLGLPYEAELLAAYPVTSGSSKTFDSDLGITIQGFLQKLIRETSQVVKLKYIADESLSYRLLFKVRNFSNWAFNADEGEDLGDITISDYLRLTARWDKSTYHYYASDETYKSQSDVWNNGFPNDAMYPGMTQWTEWDPNDRSNAVNEAELRAIRESLPENSIDTEIKRRYSSMIFDDATIGDYITLVYRPDSIIFSRHLVGKRLEMEDNGIWLTYLLGGYYDSIT